MPYPIVECSGHPGETPEPGYMVCEHLADKTAVPAYTELAAPDNLGVIACQGCLDRKVEENYILDHFVLVCAHFVRQAGYIPIT